MNWLDAKCHNCGLQREIIVFLEPNKPRNPLRCPRCESFNVTEVNSEAEKQLNIDYAQFGTIILNTKTEEIVFNTETKEVYLKEDSNLSNVRQLTDEEIKKRFPHGWPFTITPKLIVCKKDTKEKD